MKALARTSQESTSSPQRNAKAQGISLEPNSYGLEVLHANAQKSFPVQTKLSIGSPNDPFEREADAMASYAVSQLSSRSAPTIQTKCTACEEEEMIQRKQKLHGPVIQRKCAKCEEELQRKAIAEHSPTTTDHVQSQLAQQTSGNPLPKGLRGEMEAVFGAQFGNVRIHTDTPAIQMSQDLHARAFTHGKDIYFNKGEYQPGSTSGQQLIAHELTHVVQQGASQASPSIQMKPKGYADIKDKLSTGFTDWAVTDEEARWVLKRLRSIHKRDKKNKTDKLKDMVTAMEADGYVDTLFSNVSEDDQVNFEGILQEIFNRRIHKTDSGKTYVGSCEPERLDTVNKVFPEVAKWAKKGAEFIDTFLTTSKHEHTAHQAYPLLDKYFFHQKTNIPVPHYRQLEIAKEVKTVFDKMAVTQFQGTGKKKDPKIPVTCLSDFDQACQISTLAYVNSKGVHLCPDYFSDYKFIAQVEAMFHELVHHFTDVNDTAYDTERVFRYLSPENALNSADTYTLFVKEVVLGAKFKNPSGLKVKDKTENCSPALTKKIRMHMAFGERMLKNALMKIDETDAAINKANGALEKHFKTFKLVELKKVISNLKKAKKLLRKSQTIVCKSSCDNKRLFGIADGKVFICPLLINQYSEDKFADEFIATVLLKLDGLRDGPARDEKGYDGQTKEQAESNVNAYVGYARDVSKAYDQWSYLQADDRYKQLVLTRLKDERTIRYNKIRKRTVDLMPPGEINWGFMDLVNLIKDEADEMLDKFEKDLKGISIENEREYKKVYKRFRNRLTNFMRAGNTALKVYIANEFDVDILTLLEDDKSMEAWKDLSGDILIDHILEIQELIKEQAKASTKGKLVDPKNWADLKEMDKDFSTQLNLVGNYAKPYSQYSGLAESFEKYTDRKIAKLPKSKQEDYEELASVLLSKLDSEVTEIQDDLRLEMVTGDKFNKKMLPIKSKNLLKKYKRFFNMGPSKYFKKYPKPKTINPFMPTTL